MKKKIYTSEGDPVGEYEPKGKTWEDIKQRFFQETGLCSTECRETHDVICRDIANDWLEKEFASQIEKTRRESEKEVSSIEMAHLKEDAEVYKAGFKSGLQRAIELVPSRQAIGLEHQGSSYSLAYQDCINQTIENLKKEMEK